MTFLRFALLFLLVSATQADGLGKDALLPIVRGQTGEALNAVVDKYSPTGFSGYLLVTRGDEVVLSRGCGYRNREKQLPTTGESLFEIASLSKPFTAIAVLKLYEDGKVDIHQPLSKYIPEIPKAYQHVSIFYVLTHTSGMPRGGTGRGTDFGKALAAHLSEDPEFPAGQRVSYSNAGYAVLAGLVEKVSGESFEDFSHKRIFDPAGMDDTGFCGESFDDNQCALGYGSDGTARVPYIDPYPPEEFGYEYRGMGGVVTSAMDLLRFERAFSSGKLLSPGSMTLMKTAFRDTRSVGWEIFSFEEGIRCIAHGGSVRGYNAKLWIFPDYDSCLILLCNSNSIAPEIHGEILKESYQAMFKKEIAVLEAMEVARKLGDGSVSAETIEPVLGRYTSGFGVELVLESKDDALFASLSPSAEKHSPSSPAAEKSAIAIVQGLARGNTDPLRKRLPARMKKWPSWPERVLKDHWPAMAKDLGEFLSVERLGSVESRVEYREDNERMHYVWLRIKFSVGEVISLLAFNNDSEMESIVLNAQTELFGERGMSTPVRQISPKHFELSPLGSRKVDLKVEEGLLSLQSGSLVIDWRK